MEEVQTNEQPITEQPTEEVVSEPVQLGSNPVQTEEVTPVVEQPVVEQPVVDPVPVQPIKRRKKDIIGYNPETGEPIYREYAPGEIPPKKSKKGLIIGLIIGLVVIVATVIILIITLGSKGKTLSDEEYKEIINAYGEAAEKQVVTYAYKNYKIPTFDDIKDDISYDEYKVSCKTSKVNYDGSVYLASCTVDGKEISKDITYGSEVEEPVIEEKEDNNIYYYKENGKIKYTYKKDDVKKSSIVAEYDCKDDYKCSPAETEIFAPGIMSNNKTFIMELSSDKKKSQIVLFDIDEEEIVGRYDNAIWLHKKGSYTSSTDGEYILVKKANGDYYGIIDKDGKIIHDYNIGRKEASGIGSSKIYWTYYSVEGDYIVNYKNGKYGVVKITSSDTVIDAKYDDLKLIDDKYFKAQENEKWNLYSFETKEKVLNDEFDYIFGVYNDTIIVENDKKIYIKDLTGNDLLETPIDDDSKELNEQTTVTVPWAAGVTIVANTDGTIVITVYKDNESTGKAEYTFDPTTKTVTKK